MSGDGRQACDLQRLMSRMTETTPNVATLPASETTEATKSDIIGRNTSVSAAIWNRAALLLIILCLIKLAMIFGPLRKHIFEIHWRIGPEPVEWENYATFYVFALLAGLNLWVFAGHCERGGVRVVRAANAILLFLGTLFILLTFSEQNHNYLEAIMNKYLHVKDLRWYLIMNFCFRSPYLTLWLIGYALVYYGMVRKGREHLMLRVTVVCATAYLAFCFPNEWYREILLVLDCIGLVMFLGARKAAHRLNPLFLGVLVGFIVFLFVIFYGYEGMLTWHWMNKEFVALTAFTLVLFAGVTAFAWYRGFWMGWSWLLPFAFTTFLLFVNTNYVQAHNYSNFMTVGLTLPRYFLSELGITLACFGAAWAYRRWRPRGSLLWLDIVILAIIAISAIDLRLTQIMSVRLDWSVLSLALGETPKMMWRMSHPYLPSLTFGLALVVAVYAGLLALMRRARKEGNAGEGGAGFLRAQWIAAKWPLLALVLLGVAGTLLFDNDKARGQALTLLATTSPVWQHAQTPLMDAQEFNQTARKLRIWQSPEDGRKRPARETNQANALAASGSARDMNVVVIFQESTYNRYLSLFDGTNDTEPFLCKYKDRMELFPNFWSSFAGSINARFATFTGLYPVSDFNAFTVHRVPVKSLFEVLHENGYSNSLFYSSFFDYTGFRDFLHNRGIDEMYDADTMPGRGWVPQVGWGLREDVTMGAITNQIRKYAAAKKKFCLTYVPAAPHNPFDGTPAQFRKYPRVDSDDYTGPYLNELDFMDWIITGIVHQLSDSGLLDKTLIVITGDHGEMLGENHGPIGHGWAFTPQLQNVPLIIFNPARRGYRVNDTLGSQVDVLPTILDVLGIPLPTGQLYQGVSLYSANADPERTIYLNTFWEYGIFEDGLLYCGNRDKKPRASAAPGFYSFANEGAQTSFQLVDHPAPSVTNSVPSISEFDRFQANFLRNYSDYCRMAQSSTAAK